MKYFIVEFLTRDGDHEYTEYGVLSARTYESAEKKAKKGRRLFTRYGWEEFCEFDGIREIPEADFKVLQEYLTKI